MLAVVGLVLAAGLATTFTHPRNPSSLPNGLAVSIDAESTALYCTGLSSGGPRPGRITFYNTSSGPRHLGISVYSDTGAQWSGSIELAAHGVQSIEPSVLDKSTTTSLTSSYGVAVQISGGGVVADEIAYNDRAQVPCISQGLTRWFATGFNTLVGSSAYLSVFNPSATSAVVNASIYAASGITEPQSFQGLSVPAHAQREIDLGTEVVNTPNVGVRLTVLRGSLDVVGVQDSNGTLSYEEGLTGAARHDWYPNVTTVNKATAQLSIMNPSAETANVSAIIKLGSFKIAPQTVTIAPYSTGVLTVTPNSAVPVDGYANVTLRSSQPVVSALVTGASSWVALSSPPSPGNADLLHDFTGLGFDAVSVTNVSSRTITIDIVSYRAASPALVTGAGGIKLAPGSTKSLTSLLFSSSSSSNTYLVTANKPTLVVSLTLPSTPRGVNVTSPLDGR
ncbi:MAG: hypothetical protein JWM55_95 [Acidimicrobiaceae bacterium]|nr:hypothetical protein [Acidimicrobiaceae bacterium]